MSDTATATPPVQAKQTSSVVALCRALASSRDKGLPIKELSRDTGNPAVIAKGLTDGLIQIGRQNYSETPISCKPQLEKKDGKMVMVYDEYHRPIIDQEVKINLDRDWSWTNLQQTNRKSLPELLAEEDDLAEGVPPLFVRLTTAGLAASAA